MRRARSRGLGRRALPLLLAIPLVAIPMVAFLIVGGGSSGAVPVAAGSAGGVFHPVAGSFVSDSTTLTECNGSYSCLEQAFGNIAYTHGPKRALAEFDARVGRNKIVEADCHRIVHTIGSATYARYDGNVARTFAEGSSVCASGYYHGILERAFVGITSKAELGRVARRLCVDVGIRPRSFLDYQCRHGLGHGFMIQTGYDLPTALSLCSSLGSGWDRVTCTSGSFMENVSTRFGFRSAWLDEKNPLYPCDSVAAQHRRSCYVRATTWILQVEKNSFSRTAATCASAGRKWAPMCFRGFGRDAVVEARYRDFAKVREFCGLAHRFAGDCYLGAARTFGDGEGLEGARRAAQFCATAATVYRSRCAAGLGIIVGLLRATQEARLRLCIQLTARDARACAEAAEAEVDPSGHDAWG